MLRAILIKYRKQRPTKLRLYGHLPPIFKTIQIRRIRQVEHRWRNKSDVLLWTPSQVRTSVGRPARTYLQQPCGDTKYSLEDLPEVMDDRDEWRERERERVREIRASSVT